ncbi:hypothetical protein Tco_0299298 [Tanacetum coccineum]
MVYFSQAKGILLPSKWYTSPKQKEVYSKEEYLSKRENDEGGHWKSKLKKLKSTTDDNDLSQPWLCEETDLFTLQIRNFKFPKRIRMPSNIKMYDGFGDLEDHLKIFQTATKLHRAKESVPCKLPATKEKQREGESTKAFMKCFKAKSMHVKGALEYMRVSGFMHGITNLDLIKRLNDNILKSVDEMMSVTTSFLKGEVVVANQSRKKGLPS